MFSESSNHAPATYLMNTGAILSGKPSVGSWVTYGLGSENQNLPGYVLLYKVGGLGDEEFDGLNKALARLERFWVDQILYKL